MSKKRKNKKDEKPTNEVVETKPSVQEVGASVQEPVPNNQEGTGGAEQTNGATQDSQGEGAAVEEIVTTEQADGGSDSQPKTDEQDTQVDSEVQDETVGAQGAETADKVTEDEQDVETGTPELSKNKKAAKDIFERFPGKDRLFFTSDGLAFGTSVDALRHAAGLRDRTVETIIRKD